jgi:hypothetical protein
MSNAPRYKDIRGAFISPFLPYGKVYLALSIYEQSELALALARQGKCAVLTTVLLLRHHVQQVEQAF